VADEFDRAQELDALAVTSALNLQRKLAANAPRLDHTGECQNPLCGEPLDPPQLFCGPSCAREHARRSK
jgi:hypothetical protein